MKSRVMKGRSAIERLPATPKAAGKSTTGTCESEYCRSLARMASVTMASASRSWSMTGVVQYVSVTSYTPGDWLVTGSPHMKHVRLTEGTSAGTYCAILKSSDHTILDTSMPLGSVRATADLYERQSPCTPTVKTGNCTTEYAILACFFTSASTLAISAGARRSAALPSEQSTRMARPGPGKG